MYLIGIANFQMNLCLKNTETCTYSGQVEAKQIGPEQIYIRLACQQFKLMNLCGKKRCGGFDECLTNMTLQIYKVARRPLLARDTLVNTGACLPHSLNYRPTPNSGLRSHTPSTRGTG